MAALAFVAAANLALIEVYLHPLCSPSSPLSLLFSVYSFHLAFYQPQRLQLVAALAFCCSCGLLLISFQSQKCSQHVMHLG